MGFRGVLMYSSIGQQFGGNAGFFQGSCSNRIAFKSVGVGSPKPANTRAAKAKSAKTPRSTTTGFCLIRKLDWHVAKQTI